MQENITNIVTGMAEDGIATPTSWIALFTNKRAVFLKVSKHAVVEQVSPLANRIITAQEVKEIADSLKVLSIDQVMNTEYEKVVFTSENLQNLQILERPASFFRSTIKFASGNRHVTLKMYKDTVRSVKASLQMINPTNIDFPTKPPHINNVNIAYGVRAVGLIILIYSLWELVNKIGVENIFLAITGLLLIFKLKIGAYLLAITILIDLILIWLFASSIDIINILQNIIELVILTGILAFLWKFKSELR